MICGDVCEPPGPLLGADKRASVGGSPPVAPRTPNGLIDGHSLEQGRDNSVPQTSFVSGTVLCTLHGVSLQAPAARRADNGVDSRGGSGDEQGRGESAAPLASMKNHIKEPLN